MAETVTCSVCGSVNDSANTFCDQCGAKLVAPAPGTEAVPALAAAVPTAPAPVADLICSVCGAPVLPGQAFCDNCGANLVQQPPVSKDAAVAPAAIPPVVTDPDAETVISDAPEMTLAAPPAPVEATPPPAPVEATPPPAPPLAEPLSAGGKSRATLEAEIAQHRASIAQIEQLLAAQTSTAPAYLTAALDDARTALATSEADLATIPAAAPAEPAPDPAEVARLNAEIEQHKQSVAQLEQLMRGYPDAVPSYLTVALDDARAALARAEGDLNALTGGVSVAVAGAPAAPAAPVEAAPAALRPCLKFEDGRIVYLPTDKAEIIVGREDPVSDIYPEVDLTSFGGETGGVSRQHARLHLRGEQWSVSDLNSTNFTKVNGKRLEPGTEEPLKDGDQVHFGRIAVVFALN